MKKITFIPFLAFLVSLFSTIVGHSQNTNITFDNTSASLTTTPACSFNQCNAQDVNFGDVYLGDNVGNVATLAYISNPVNGLYIWVTVSSNSSKYDLLFQFDYLVGGVRKNFDNTNFVGATTDRLTIKIRGSIITAGSKYRMAQITNYTAGQSLELKNIYLSWETSGQAITPAQSLSLINCNPPKCSSALSSGIIIKTPLFADFSINKSCDGDTYQKVVYTSTSTGVEPNTNYSWSFPGAATISPVSLTTIGPYTVTYSSTGPFSASLTVSDPTNQVIPNTKTVNNITLVACCTPPVITAITASSICSGGTFTVTPANGTNGTVPVGTLYSWAAPNVIGISGTAAGNNAANISGTLTNSTNAPINVIYNVTPTSGICTGSTFTVTVTVNPKPILNNITASSICSGDTFTVAPTNGTNGTVPSGTTYSWSAPNVIGITGTTAGSNAPNISGTLTNSTNAPINVVYTVTPTAGICSGSTFTVTVTVNPLPTAIISGTIAVCKDATAPNVTFTGSAGVPPYTFTYNINGGSNSTITTIIGNSVTIAAPTSVTGPFAYNLVSVQDSSSTTCSQLQTGTATITVNPLPICSITGPDGPVCPSSTNNSYSAPTGMSNYTWSVSGNATINGNATSQTVLITAGANCGTSFTLTLIITDVNGCESTCTKIISVQDTTAPTWTTAPTTLDVTLQCSDTNGLTTAQASAPVATDNCGGIVTYTKVSGTFAQGNCVNSGTYTNTWTATDVCTNVSTVFTQTITIQDTTAPTWTTAPTALDVILECSDTNGLTAAQASAPVATDNCGGTVTYTIVSGTFAQSNCVNSGTYTNTWTATDVCTNVSTVFTQTITIQDTTAPTWTTAPTALDVTLECSDTNGLTAAQASAPVATDNCGGTVTYTKVSGTFAQGNCVNSGTYTNTWTATDVCTNVSTVFTQTITIQDTTTPTWTTAPTALDVTLECSDTNGLTAAQASTPVATDNCGGTVTYTKVSGTFAQGNCVNSGTYTNTWTATDVCTNVSTVFTQTITIQDTTAPTWTTAPTALDVTLECSDTNGLTAAQASAPVATDNCGGTVTYTKVSGTFAQGNCVNSGTYTNTWTATDVCTNVSTVFTQTITIQDTTAPTWTTAPTALDVTLECSDTNGLTAAQASAPVATDNCGGTVTYTKVSGTFAQGNCVNSGTYTNTWTATDVCTNVSTVFTQTITIQDTTAPTWTTAPTALDVTLECSDTNGLTAAQASAPVATDNCGGTVTYTKVSGTFAQGNCVNSGTYTNTWTATDVCTNVSTVFTQTITIQDTTAPTWTTAPTALDVTLECSDTNGLTAAQASAPVATDNCGGTVTYTKVSGTFAQGNCVNSGTYTNTWTATDVCTNVSTVFTQTITIQDTTTPTWTTAPTALDVTLQCSDTNGLTAAQASAPVATDNCGGTVTYTKVSGTFAQGNCVNSGTYTNTWTATDVCTNVSTVFTQTITIQDTTAPTWTTAPTALDVTLQCSDTNGLTAAQASAPVATDNCGGTVTYTKTSGIFQRGACGSTGTYTNTWTANDVCNNTSSIFTQVITVQDTAIPTWITQAGTLDITLQCSDASGLATAQNQAPTATANCSIVTYTKTSGLFVASTSCANAGTYTNSWIAKDDCGNITDAFTQVITIEDTTKPTWTTAPTALNITLECSDAEGLTTAQASVPIATDNCDSSVTNIVKVSGQFVASESCGNSGTYTNTWTVKDECGNTSDTFTQVITIQDTTKPTWTTAPTALNITLECSDAEGLTTAQTSAPIATDNCDSSVTNIVKVSGQFVASESCGNSGTYTNTWTVKDECGNTSDTFTQVITIQDTTKPTWTTAPTALNITLECSDAEGLTTAQTSAPIATDNCDSSVTNIVKVSGQFVASESCGNSGTYTNTWTVKDGCGNTSDTFTQVITIQDTTKPTWTTAPTALNITLECSDAEGLTTAQTSAPIATDNCDSSVTNIVKVSGQFVASESCGNSGTYTNTWTVKDGCGNTSDTFTQVITIEDTTKPTFNGELPTDITVSCDKVPEAANITAADNCNVDVPVVYSETKSNIENECSTNYILTRKWTTSDCSGNTTSFTQVITVKDTTPPTGTAPADITNLNSILDIPAANPNAITDAADNCSQTVNITISDSNNGGTGCVGAPYILTRTYTLTDCAGNKTILVQTITIKRDVIEPRVVYPTQACNADESTVNLFGPLPRNTTTVGTWIDTDNTHALQGNVVTTYGLPVGNYSFEYQIQDEVCPRSLFVNLQVNDDCKVLACGTIIVHNAFSPNGDSFNNKFVIDNIEDTTCYPDNTVEIYNRWGVLVFETRNYNNTTNAFDGYSRGRTTVKQSDGLPTGTYFYILNYTSVDGNGAIQTNKKDGYLYLSR